MVTENAKKLIAALRSGRFKQGFTRLTMIQDGEDFDCCLGVACKVAMEEGIYLKVQRYSGVVTYDDCLVSLPDVVRDWLGFTTESGRFNTDEFLTDKNDIEKLSFESIADLIESDPEGLFV